MPLIFIRLADQLNGILGKGLAVKKNINQNVGIKKNVTLHRCFQ